MCCLPGFASVCAAEFVPGGEVTSTDVQEAMVDLQLSSGAVARVGLPGPGLARVRINPTGSLSTRESLSAIPQQSMPPANAITVWYVLALQPSFMRRTHGFHCQTFS